ncbi:MAG TPA: inositol monophosphatase family protein [Polyangiales bacterium]|nr:inositol monophosphatase family protein [Polyangiales bacterium]
MSALRPETQAALAAVRAGLDVALRRTDAERVTAKAGVDIVTGADIAAEHAIRRVLEQRCPALPIVGEEGGGTPAPDGGAYWLVDPICGTRNYASQLALFATNVALIEAGQATIAVVGDGGTRGLSFAERGRGAFRESGERLCARDGSVIGLELGGKPPYSDPALAPFVAALCADGRYYLRLLGSTLPLAKVASGDLAGCVLLTETADALHTAAGCLLAEEAGALVSDRSGRAWTLETRSLVLAATPALQQQLLSWLGSLARSSEVL